MDCFNILNCIFCGCKICKIKVESKSGVQENISILSPSRVLVNEIIINCWSSLLDLSPNSSEELIKLFDNYFNYKNQKSLGFNFDLKTDLSCLNCQNLVCSGENILEEIKKMQNGLEDLKTKFKNLIQENNSEPCLINEINKINSDNGLKIAGDKARKIILQDICSFTEVEDLKIIENINEIEDDLTDFEFQEQNSENENEEEDYVIDNIKVEEKVDEEDDDNDSNLTVCDFPMQESSNNSEEEDDDDDKKTKLRSGKRYGKCSKNSSSVAVGQNSNVEEISVKEQYKIECDDENTDKCDICNLTFSGIREKPKYFEHKYHVHGGPKVFKCLVTNCDQLCGTYNAIIVHQDNAHHPPVKCPYCEKEVPRYHLSKHISRKHSSERKTAIKKRKVKRINCSPVIKGGNFSLEINPEDKDKEIDMSKCEICNIKIKGNKANYFGHKFLYHGGPKVFKCSLSGCEGLFGTMGKLIIHRDNVHNPPIVCPEPECGKRVAKYNLVKHMQRNHLDKSKLEFKCSFPECDKNFKTLDSLKRHEDVHRSNSKFLCEFCSKIFRTEYYLKQHIRKCKNPQNSNNNIYNSKNKLQKRKSSETICEICGKNYNSEKIKVHIDLMHKDKNLKCPKCPKSFSIIKALKRHEKRHL